MCLSQIAAQFVMSPPIRNEQHQKGIRQALADNVLQIVGTDHCPFNKSQKAAGLTDFRKIPNGVNGIEASQSLLLLIIASAVNNFEGICSQLRAAYRPVNRN